MKKTIEWGTPKRIQMDAERAPRSFKPPKKFKMCKGNKEGHVFEWTDWKRYSFMFGSYREGKCKFCGKKKYEHVADLERVTK